MVNIVSVRLSLHQLNWLKRESFNCSNQTEDKQKEPSNSRNLKSNKERVSWSICKLDGRYLSQSQSITLLQMENKLFHLLCTLLARKINTSKPSSRWGAPWNLWAHLSSSSSNNSNQRPHGHEPFCGGAQKGSVGN